MTWQKFYRSMWIGDFHNSVAWTYTIHCKMIQSRCVLCVCHIWEIWKMQSHRSCVCFMTLAKEWRRRRQHNVHVHYSELPGNSSSKSVSYSELASPSNTLWNEGDARVVPVWSSSDSGRDTIVETEPGMRAPALKPVRRRGSVDLPLSTELFIQVWGVEPSPGKCKKSHIKCCGKQAHIPYLHAWL